MFKADAQIVGMGVFKRLNDFLGSRAVAAFKIGKLDQGDQGVFWSSAGAAVEGDDLKRALKAKLLKVLRQRP